MILTPAFFLQHFVQVCIYANVTSSSSESHMTSTKKSLGFPMARRKDCLEAGGSRRSARDGDEAGGRSSESLLPRRPETKVGRDWALSSPGNSSISCLSSSCLLGSDSLPPASLRSSLQCDPVLQLPVDKSQRWEMKQSEPKDGEESRWQKSPSLSRPPPSVSSWWRGGAEP